MNKKKKARCRPIRVLSKNTQNMGNFMRLHPFERKSSGYEPLEHTQLPRREAEIDPNSLNRINLMYAFTADTVDFTFEFERSCKDRDLCRTLSGIRRKALHRMQLIGSLVPSEDSILEQTISLYSMIVSSYAVFAQNEPDETVKSTFDFLLLNNFDHLYRFANLYSLDRNSLSKNMVRQSLDITPGRPSVAQSCDPADTVKESVNFDTTDIRTKLSVLTLAAMEKQALRWCQTVSSLYDTDLGRRLFHEIAGLKDQHVSILSTLFDPTYTLIERLLLQVYTECYLNHSCLEAEIRPDKKAFWASLLDEAVYTLREVSDLLYAYEGEEWDRYVPDVLPEPMRFSADKDYIRTQLAENVELVSDGETYRNIHHLPADHRFFAHQNQPADFASSAASHIVVEEHIRKKGADYRSETKPNPVYELSDRTHDNIELGRTRKSTYALL